MKKFLLLLFTALLCLMSLQGKDLTSSQLRMRSEIETFLREEGFMPEIDSDGDIKFKKEGIRYFVIISDRDTSPMYLSLVCSYNYPSDFSKDVVKLASVELNFYKGVKVLCFDNSLRYQADMYLRDAETFKNAFYKLMDQLESVRSDLRSECENVQKTKYITDRQQ